CISPVTSPSRPRRERKRSGSSASSSSASSQPSSPPRTYSCRIPSVADSGPPAYEYQPPSAAMFGKPCSVRKRSISSSGLIPGSRHHGIHHLRVRYIARLPAVPALLHDAVDERLLVEVHACCLKRNQKNPLGASVSRYGSSPIGGKLVRPNISSGTIPSYRERSSWTGCAERARLWTQRITSSSHFRMCAKIRELSELSGS